MHSARLRSSDSEAISPLVALSTSTEDHVVLCRLLRSSKWKIICTRTLEDGLRQSVKHAAPVVISAGVLREGTWELVLEQLRSLPSPPRLIVASRMADERLWAQVLNVGGWDVLAQPFDAREVLHSVSLARDSWCREWRPMVHKTPAVTPSLARTAAHALGY